MVLSYKKESNYYSLLSFLWHLSLFFGVTLPWHLLLLCYIVFMVSYSAIELMECLSYDLGESIIIIRMGLFNTLPVVNPTALIFFFSSPKSSKCCFSGVSY